MKEIEEIFKNASETTEEDLKQLEKAAKDLEEDFEFQQDLLKSLEEEKILKEIEVSKNNL